jgi:4-amino-4-deoxy-L-arabinose transferase-like glycosyltransferase
MFNLYLTFSDAAKFADVARNIFFGFGKISNFNFWGTNNSQWIQPVMPYSIAVFFKFFGINDFAVIATSFFYFLLSLVFVYLLTQKLYKDRLTSILSTVAVGFNYNNINYATSGASESPFMFEILASIYLLSFKKWWGNTLGLLFIVLMYLTRPQAIIYILGLILYYFFNNFKFKKAVLYSMLVIGFGSVVYLFLSKQGLFAITQTVTNSAVSDALRGGTFNSSLISIIKKTFYNLYNFYKAMPDIMNPYIFALFVIGIFKKQTTFNITALFMVVVTFLVTALTIPFYRYLHPVVPVIYIVGIATLVELFRENKYKAYTTSFLVLFFCIGQTLGILLLDSRFEKNTHNINKPPIYVEMSLKLKDITDKDSIVLTNLDTWGSWYGERKTVWFPLEPSMILTKENEIKYIYLTSYKIDDENYYMGENWREIFNNPDKQKILKDYKFVSEYRFNAEENYERENGRAVLLERIK